ncbi:MAG: cobalamin biosynthesis protein CobD, partial [Betaproteobacteria bacterium]|nr:cobalamin biosynthesis protein CobD [Betaproteobacteria bacterium]
MCRQAIDQALIASHRHVFGPLLAYVLLPGILGPVLYRLAEVMLNRWQHPAVEASGDGSLSIEDSDRHRLAAQRGFSWFDWIPVRLNAAGLTVVGNFEDAVYSWRNYADRWSDELVGIILSAGGGALGVRLGEPEEKAMVLQADATAVDVDSLELESQPGAEA